MSLEQACAQADLVVMGILHGKEEPPDPGLTPFCRVTGGIRVGRVLFGTPPSPKELPVSWQRLKPGSNIVCWEPEAFEGQEGLERIWCLTRDADGALRALHPSQVRLPEDLDKVAAAIRERLAPDLKILEEFPGFVLAGKPGQKIDQVQALDRLARAGEAASSCVETLLKHRDPVRRAYGCELAGRLGNRLLSGRLVALLEDAAKLDVTDGCIGRQSTIGEMALEALRKISGKPGASAKELKAWAVLPSPQP